MTSSADESEFFDAEPLRLSGALDDFEFDLLDCDDLDDDGERLLAIAGGSSSRRASFVTDFSPSDAMRGSASMDFQYEGIKSSLTEMRIDSINGDDARRELQAPSEEPRSRGERDRPPSPPCSSMGWQQGRFQQVGEVDFDPPAQRQQQQQFTMRREQGSISDLSTYSQGFQTKPVHRRATDSAAADARGLARPIDRRASDCSVQRCQEYSQEQYGEALRNLAESMKRTEATRRHVVMMQRDVLTPEQRRALSSAKERLREENQRVRQTSAQGSIVGGFLSGIGTYMGQVNRQML